MISVKLILMFCCLRDVTGQFRKPLNKYIHHYEGLYYDTEALHNSHQRAKRALSPQDRTVQLNFDAHGRHFNLRMKRETAIFSPDLIIEVSGNEAPIDTSHIYSGELFGEKGSLTHGSVVDGRFEGFIKTHHGTYYVEPSERYLKEENVPFHSVIYHEDDINYPHKYGSEGGCADHSVFERMRKYQASVMEEPVKGVNSVLEEESSQGPVILRRKRAVAKDKNTCQLYIQTDHLFFKYYGTREAVLAQISSHVKTVDTIFQATDFMGFRNIGFMVKRVRINTTDNASDESNPFRSAKIGVEKFLEFLSEQNHDDYCLAYIFTDRDFNGGVLGLAWLGLPFGGSGGICERNRPFSGGRFKSMNTGIITVQNYRSHIPPKVSHLTFAHEVGHNFGAPHDSGVECIPGESKLKGIKEQGNYIMYPRATSGDKFNNHKFSNCSLRKINVVLKKKNTCFVESGKPICGNGLVEAGEECDCGYNDECEDPCCYSADEGEGKKCKVRPGKICSPSQGPCCTEECTFKGTDQGCRPESECAQEGKCSGAAALCPASEPKGNFTTCHSDTQVCLNGVCAGSICAKYGLEDCTCAIKDSDDEATELCHVCCMEKTNPSTCNSSGSDELAKYFNKTVITLQPGSPCNNFEGYCDVFSRCRQVDADGPLARLTNAIFNPELYESIAEWIVSHRWAVLLMGIALLVLMAGFIKVCSIHTPSSNPKLPPPKPLPGTLKRRRQQNTNQQLQGQRHHRQYQENYQMGQLRH